MIVLNFTAELISEPWHTDEGPYIEIRIGKHVITTITREHLVWRHGGIEVEETIADWMKNFLSGK